MAANPPALDCVDLAIAGGVATVTLNRPDRMNSLNAQLKRELAQVLALLADPAAGVRVVIFTGAGDRAFCAGADIKERSGEAIPAPRFYFHQKKAQDLFTAIENLEQPTIAAINGVALGGGAELALACDLRLAAEGARIGLPEARLGMIPLGGGTQRLPRLIGAARAKEMVFTGEPLDADAALAVGLVNRVVPADGLMDACRALAGKIAAMPPLAVTFAKRAINAGMQTDIASAMEFELYAGCILNDSEDRQEGMRAFVEKRPPVFKGR